MTSFLDIPFVLSIGPQRAGTSWLDRYLRSRGDICLPNGVKETFFFDRHVERGQGFYKNYFQIDAKHKIAMEVTTTSFDHKDAAQNIKDFFGYEPVKLLCPLRDPIRRSYSLYKHYVRYGLVQGPLEDAIKDLPQIVESSYYTHHIQRWQSHFPDQEICFLFQEELDVDQGRYLKKVCDFLNIHYMPPENSITGRYNATTFGVSANLARLTQQTADFLRAKQILWPINYAKKLGMKNIIFGGEKEKIQPNNISDHDFKILQDRLGAEKETLEKHLKMSLPFWQ